MRGIFSAFGRSRTMTIEAEAFAVDSRCASSCGRVMDDNARTLFSQRGPEKSMMTGSTSHILRTEDVTHDSALVERKYANETRLVALWKIPATLSNSTRGR